jgi:hypothetical protein
LVVAGAEKSATTMIAAVLGEHPAVEMAPGEVFDLRDQYYEAGSLDALRRRFTGSTDLRRGFRCADYMGWAEVPARLARDLSTPDVMFTLREPVRRAIGAWYRYVRLGLLPVEQPTAAFTRILRGDVEGYAFPYAREKILEWGLYGRHLQHRFDSFPPTKVHVIFDFELRKDAEHSITTLYRELDLDPAFHPTMHHRRHNAGVYSLTRLRWLRLRHRWTWRLEDDGIWTSARPTRPLPALGNAAVVATDRLILSHMTRSEPEPLDPETMRQLHAYYRSDILLLEDLCQVDLRQWLDCW